MMPHARTHKAFAAHLKILQGEGIQAEQTHGKDDQSKHMLTAWQP
jgi:hypothetical protein